MLNKSITLILLSTFSFICTQNLAQNMKDASIIDFGNNTYAIQFAGYTSLVVIGSEGVLITDPANTERAEILKNEIKQLTDKQVSHVVLSHEHYDHVGGTEVFDEAKIVGHEFTEIFFQLDGTGESPRRLDISFKQNLSINLGNRQVDLYFYGPGDGVTSTIIFEPQQKVVIATDMYMADLALFPGIATMDDVNLLGTRKILNTILAELKPKYALNGHSPVTEVKYLEIYAKFYNDLYDYCDDWIVRTKNTSGPSSIYSKTLDFAETADLPAYNQWKFYEALKTYVRRMVMSIHHGG